MVTRSVSRSSNPPCQWCCQTPHAAHPGLLVTAVGQQHRTPGLTHRRGVILAHADTFTAAPKVRGGDLTAEGADIGITHIIVCDNHDDVWMSFCAPCAAEDALTAAHGFLFTTDSPVHSGQPSGQRATRDARPQQTRPAKARHQAIRSREGAYWREDFAKETVITAHSRLLPAALEMRGAAARRPFYGASLIRDAGFLLAERS